MYLQDKYSTIKIGYEKNNQTQIIFSSLNLICESAVVLKLIIQTGYSWMQICEVVYIISSND